MNNCIRPSNSAYRHLCLDEREEIAIGLARGHSLAFMASKLGRHKSTISREIRRNAPPKNAVSYRAGAAQRRCEIRKRQAHFRERLKCPFIKSYVEEKLRVGWTPEQIAGRVRIDHPEYKTNYESIYQWIYTRRRDLIPTLPRSHRMRRKRGSAPFKHATKIPNRVSIDQRPKIVNSRKQAGHWEADTLISRQSKAAVAVVHERKTRFCLISHLNQKTAALMRRALISNLKVLPTSLCRTITFDNGTENTEHSIVDAALGTRSFFCNPFHSWEKGGVENCIGLIRRVYPKKTDWSLLTQKDCDILAERINSLPRKCLGFRNSKEAFVALTG